MIDPRIAELDRAVAQYGSVYEQLDVLDQFVNAWPWLREAALRATNPPSGPSPEDVREGEWDHGAHMTDRRIFRVADRRRCAPLPPARTLSEEEIARMVEAQHMGGDDRYAMGYNAGIQKMAFLIREALRRIGR